MDISGPHMQPSQVMINTLVSAGNSHDILHSVIDGKLIMKDRCVLGIDEEKIIADARQHMEAINRRANI